jgi:small conductance mechanosensitive channel
MICILAAAVPVIAQDPGAETAKQDADPPAPSAIGIDDPSMDNDELALRLLPLSEDEMAAAASAWFGLLQDKIAEIVDAKIAVRDAEGDEAERLQERILALGDERKPLAGKYALVLDAWEAKGGDPDTITLYRKYLQAVLVGEFKATDPATLLSHLLDWLGSREGGVAIVLKLAVVVGSFLGLLIIARIVRRMSRRWLEKVPTLSTLLQSFLVLVIYWLTLVAGIMTVLALLGINVTPLFAVVGGASFIVAFALQETLGNLASGLLIMITKPFDVGDFVDAAGVSGTVANTSIVATTIKTIDNKLIVVPNNKIWGSIITNVNAMPTRRVDLVFGIGYGDDIALAQKVLEETVAAHPLVLDKPEPMIRVNELADSSVNFICRPWAKTGDYWDVYWDLTRQVKERFDAAGLSIPFPQQDVHLHGLPPGAQSTG